MKDHIVGRLTTFFIQITGDGTCDSSGVTHVLDAGEVRLRLLDGYFRYLPLDGD